MRLTSGVITSWCCLAVISCGPGDGGPSSEPPPAAERTAPWVYVTNEASGDLSIIDAGSHEVLATVPLGKRPRGIRLSADNKLLYVALSGSPFGGPGIDRSTLPPADKSADGIGVFDIEQNKLVKILDGGSDPEQLAVSLDGTKMYIANEDVGLASIVDIAENRVLKTLEVGDEPEGVGISPDGKFVYVTSEDDAMISVIDTRERLGGEDIRGGAAAARGRFFSRLIAGLYQLGEKAGRFRWWIRRGTRSFTPSSSPGKQCGRWVSRWLRTALGSTSRPAEVATLSRSTRQPTR